MKIIPIVILSVVSALCMSAQHADIEGDTRIVGKLKIINDVGDSSVFIGANAGMNDNGNNNNTFVGNNAGQSNTIGRLNTFFGTQAGKNNAQGNNNAFFGFQAGLFNTTGGNNAFYGFEAGRHNTEGNNNAFFGLQVGRNNTTGIRNAFFGQQAGYNNTTGSINAFFGSQSGRNNTSGSANSFFGRQAGLSNSTGSYNAFFGQHAGQNNTIGRENTFIGVAARGVNDSLINAIAIGYQAVVNCDSCAVIGTSATKLGVGINHPEAKLHIGGIGNESQLLLENGGDILWKKNDSTIQSVLSLHTNNNIFFDSPDDFILRSNAQQVVQIESGGNVGIGTITPGQKLDVDGNARFRSIGTTISGNMALHVTSDGTLSTNASDNRLKENIHDTTDILAKALQLKTYSYNYKSDPDKRREYGLIAQELEKLFPELVFTNPTSGYKGIHYDKLSVVLIKAISELHEDFESRLSKLESLITP